MVFKVPNNSMTLRGRMGWNSTGWECREHVPGREQRPGTSGSCLCHPYPLWAQQCHSQCWGDELSPAVPWLQCVPGLRDSPVSHEHLQPLGTHPSCQGSSRHTVTPALPLPWDAAGRSDGRKQERGHGAPASLQAGPAGCGAGAVSVCAGQGSRVQELLPLCSLCLAGGDCGLCHTTGARAGSGV